MFDLDRHGGKSRLAMTAGAINGLQLYQIKPRAQITYS